MANTVSVLSEESLLNFVDIVSRTLRNRLVSPIYRILYISLVDLYPTILDGEKTAVQIWRVRENAGWPSKESTTKFLQDLQFIGAITYDPGKYNASEEDRVGYITANMKLFPYPEMFDTKTVEQRRKARAAEEKKAKQFRNPLQLFQCEECGSNQLVYDAVAKCQACHHVHSPIKDIPASMITIEAEIIELADEFFGEAVTETQIPIVRTAQMSLPETPIPPSLALGKHPRGIACPDCHSQNHWRAVPTSYGTELYICDICSPE